MTYTQCLLFNGNTMLMACIPTSFAEIGKKIQLGTSKDVWTVSEKFSICSDEEITSYSHFYKHYVKIRGL